jgi:glycosyltransferase involved in cell wall biosynthesis
MDSVCVTEARAPFPGVCFVVSVPQLDRSGSAEAVRVAIIVPAHQQPGLLVEALDTALSQDTDFAYAVVVINDGCPFDETDHVCREFAAANQDRVYYLHKCNGGLSAARNTGIDFALTAFPALDAVYFLDADNRIGPCLLQRLYDALRSAGPEIGWAYPDVEKFGYSEFCDTSGPYSPLEHLFRNFCEAGSMASRRMLDAGVRFDEAMRQGSEDWEFWLHGLERGFRGVHVPGAGFRYRRRGESTLVKSERDYRPLLEYIRACHPRLFDLHSIMRLEAAESCRYALYLPDRPGVYCLTDADDDGERISVDELIWRLLRSLERPDYGRCPGHILVMDSALFELLRAHRILKAVLWVFEQMMLQCPVVTCRVTVEHTDGERAASWHGNTYPADLVLAEAIAESDIHIAAVHAQTLADSARTQPSDRTQFGYEPWKPYQDARLDLRLRIPGDPTPTPAAAGDQLLSLCAMVARSWAREEHGAWSAAPIDRYRCGIAMPWDLYVGTHHLATVLPLCSSENTRQVALVVDPVRAEATLTALAPFAAFLRGQGWRIHLIGLGGGALSWSAESHELFDSIVPLPFSLAAPAPRTRSQDAYIGTPIPRISGGDGAASVGTLAGFDLIISVENVLVHAVAGRLRDLKVETWALLGLADAITQRAEIVNACAAFEHAYRTIVVLDAQTFRLCRALGLPVDKLRRWGEGDLSDNDWCQCPRLQLPQADLPGSSAK